MLIHHPIGFLGLGLSVVSALLLPKPGKERYTADGIQVLSWCSVRPKDEEQKRQWRRKHYIDKYVDRCAKFFLYFGFVLQAVDLLTSS